MAEAVYILCALTSIACAVLLFRGYAQSRSRFLLWSALCFTGLAINNALLFLDKVIYADQALTFLGLSFVVWRSVAALAGLGVLVYGLIWDAE